VVSIAAIIPGFNVSKERDIKYGDFEIQLPIPIQQSGKFPLRAGQTNLLCGGGTPSY
jgi:hypothetical protein